MAGVSRLKRGTAEKVSEAVSSNVADIDMWAAHTHQVVALLLQIQRTGEEKEKAWAHERAAAAAEALAAARGAKLENALHAGIVAAQGRGVNATFRSWAAAVRSMREAEVEARRERSEQRTERLASAGRGEMLDEHSRLLRDAAQAGRTVQGMKEKLQERSQELERSLLRDTLTFQLWTSDARRTAQLIKDAHATHELQLTRQLEMVGASEARQTAVAVQTRAEAMREGEAVAAAMG